MEELLGGLMFCVQLRFAEKMEWVIPKTLAFERIGGKSLSADWTDGTDIYFSLCENAIF